MFGFPVPTTAPTGVRSASGCSRRLASRSSRFITTIWIKRDAHRPPHWTCCARCGDPFSASLMPAPTRGSMCCAVLAAALGPHSGVDGQPAPEAKPRAGRPFDELIRLDVRPRPAMGSDRTSVDSGGRSAAFGAEAVGSPCKQSERNSPALRMSRPESACGSRPPVHSVAREHGSGRRSCRELPTTGLPTPCNESRFETVLSMPGTAAPPTP